MGTSSNDETKLLDGMISLQLTLELIKEKCVNEPHINKLLFI